MADNPAAYAVTARALQWREPSDHPQDDDEATLVAEGIAGRYSIHKPEPVKAELLKHAKPEDIVMIDGEPHFRAMLWWPHDEFIFDCFDSVDEAKIAAEADWQTRFRALVAWPLTPARSGDK